MGLTRKLMSVSTLGAVDFKSDKERIATYTKDAAKEAKRTRKIAEQEAARERLAQRVSAITPPAVAASPQAGPPAGWMVDANDSTVLRWWDGMRWTEHTQPRT